MCLILVSYKQSPGYRLVIASNRDEFYDRPTQPASFWEEAPIVLGGRDLKACGTWLGVTRTGRFAMITNYRDPGTFMPTAPSRGGIVSGFLRSPAPPREFLTSLEGKGGKYNGFSLLAGDFDTLYSFSNRGRLEELNPGIYGLSNHLLDTPWPKVETGKKKLRSVLDRGDFSCDEIFSVLDDRQRPPDKRLPDTGVGLEWERILSPAFIESPVYGTRSSTVVLVADSGEVTFLEKDFNSSGQCGVREFNFRIKGR